MQRSSLRYVLLALFVLSMHGIARAQTVQAPADTTKPVEAPKTDQSVAGPQSTTPQVPVADPTRPETSADAAGPGTDEAKPAGPVLKNGKHVKKKKEKAPKLVPVTVEHGVVTVDGWTGKADLNYQIADFHFFYIWSPGLGTVVVSNQDFRGAKFEPNAFDGGTLTIQADGHTVQLASEHKLLQSKKAEGAYVLVDPETPPPSRFLQVGYGMSSKPPYAWPGGLADTNPNTKAPPLPDALRPTVATTTKCDIDGAGKKTNCHDVVASMYLGKNDKGELKQSDLVKDPTRPEPHK